VSLEKLLHNYCELELNSIDMVVNSKKSFCLRVGPRYDVKCSKVVSSTGQVIPWSNKIRYLSMYIIGSRKFKCWLVIAKKSFYRAANAILGKFGRHASKRVILELISSKCRPYVCVIVWTRSLPIKQSCC